MEQFSIPVALSVPGEQAAAAAGQSALAAQDGSVHAGWPGRADSKRQTPWSCPAVHERLIPVLVVWASEALARFLFVLVVALPRLVSEALARYRVGPAPVGLFAAASSPDPVATAARLWWVLAVSLVAVSAALQLVVRAG